MAVGAVILNRIEHPSFPDTLAGVIYQPGAFSCLNDGQFNEPVADSAKRAAQDAINGWDPSGGAIYYFNPQTATNKWIWSRPAITTIGKHVFVPDPLLYIDRKIDAAKNAWHPKKCQRFEFGFFRELNGIR